MRELTQYSPPSKRIKTKWLPEEQIVSINEAAVPKSTKMATNFG